MKWLMYIAIAVVSVITFLAWGFFRIKNRAADAVAGLRTVQEQQIPGLVAECIRVCHEKLGVTLDLRDFENAAENLDYLLEPKQRTRMKTAFELPEHAGRFVMPLGAFIGELVRAHNPEARWIRREGGGLAMEIPQGATTLTMHPFDKVLKHGATGQGGEIIAYLNVAMGRTPAT